ncbi:MAG: protein kinase [Elusimicrobia bacterium]|nr:protein kinase [Elusimicrobiota bacterium]
MKRALAPLWLVGLLVFASAADVRADDKKDALAGVLPSSIAWRLPPLAAAPGRAPVARSDDSEGRLAAAERELSAEPAGKGRDDVLAALSDLQAAAAALPAAQRQAYIDSHLGAFNEAVRELGPAEPAGLRLKAARAAARLDANAGRWKDALGFAEAALELSPDDPGALVSRSRANAGLGDASSAYADADRAARISPKDAAAYAARAAASYGLGDYPHAAEDARRAVALDPKDMTAFDLMKLSEGRASAASALGAPKTELAASVERDYHAMVQQESQADAKRLSPAEAPAPRDVERLVSDAGEKLSIKDYWGAVDSADKALALDPTDARALYFRAAAHNLIGDYGEAAIDATRGLTIRPDDTALRDARSWAYNRMGRYRDAVADAHYSLEIDPKDAYAFANRAYADEQKGDYPSMLADYKTAAGLDPQFDGVYRDAARRHGLSAGPGADRSRWREARRLAWRRRAFATILLSSLIGGLLIGFGLLHVGSAWRDSRARRRAATAPPSGLEADYDIGRAIGQGGMGVVYEAFDKRLKRPVAIKMLRDEYKLDDAAKADFLEEARTVAELHHPAIVDIHGIVEDERGLYLVFERLEGRTLDQVLAERRRLSLSEIKRILEPVCAALEYAQARDVVHRDLKPSNVMLTPGGVKVLDFGISRHAARAGAKAVTRTVVGTPHYMAPEQEYGLVQKESDVFSLGAVLYEMTTGVRPFEGSSQAKLAKAYRRASSLVRGVPLELEALIDASLEPDADKRLPSPAEFRRRLMAIPDGAPVAA